ncbi:hypothetical protein [Streptomyces sp. NPDC046727]|uniref:hypothetical protein n=1 Tax=Streptomyces sp. NPDC046727 TaxID=3155373 RepID=UPI003405E828
MSRRQHQRRTLSQDHVTGLLEGTAFCDWEDVERLVQVLDGEPTFFRPYGKRLLPPRWRLT